MNNISLKMRQKEEPFLMPLPESIPLFVVQFLLATRNHAADVVVEGKT